MREQVHCVLCVDVFVSGIVFSLYLSLCCFSSLKCETNEVNGAMKETEQKKDEDRANRPQ